MTYIIMLFVWINHTSINEKKHKCISKSFIEAVRLQGNVNSIIVKSSYASKQSKFVRRPFNDDGRINFNEYGEVIYRDQINAKGAIISKQTIKFDEYNCPCEKRMQYQNDSLNFTIKQTYDYKNLIIESRKFNVKSELIYIEKAQYNKFGNVIQEVYSDSTNQLMYTIDFEYNNNNDLIRQMTRAKDNNTKFDYTANYNYNEGVVEHSYNVQNVIISTDKLNEKGDIIQNKLQDNSSITIYKYKYDKKGNWIKKTSYVDNIPQYNVKRIIKYY